MNLTFEQFNKRIGFGHYENDEAWRSEVGYRPNDKDSGFKRWLELTDNCADDYIDEFRRVVYGDKVAAGKEVKQYDLFGN